MDKTVDAIIKKAEGGDSERRIIDEQRRFIDLLYQLCGLLMEKLERCRADLKDKAWSQERGGHDCGSGLPSKELQGEGPWAARP